MRRSAAFPGGRTSPSTRTMRTAGPASKQRSRNRGYPGGSISTMYRPPYYGTYSTGRNRGFPGGSPSTAHMSPSASKRR